MKTILIIDDEKNMRWALEKGLGQAGYRTVSAPDGPGGLESVASESPDIVLLDLKMPGMDGLDVLRLIKELRADLPVIIITAHGSVATAIEAMRAGAYDYVSKPFNLEEIQISIEKALEVRSLTEEVAKLRSEVEQKYSFQNIIGKSPKMQAVFDLIDRVAATSASVLIFGESGTGKELAAKAIHYLSPRRHRPYIQVNCSALPETLLESELFGHEKGAFTGAVARRLGRFELADKGTLFLDEIGELTPPVQVKLLRVLQEKSFERVGGGETIRADVRIITATNRDLNQAMAEGKFREDLFYRLNVVPITLPPLRERSEDIPLLAEHFLKKYEFSGRPGAKPKTLTAEAVRRLAEYRWPGNVRELENAIERAVIISRGDRITVDDLPRELQPYSPQPLRRAAFKLPEGGVNLEEVERDLIRQALERTGGNQTQAARLLGITRHTLLYRIDKYGLKGSER